MNRMLRAIAIICSITVASTSGYLFAQERIDHFESTIEVDTDGTLTVTERITVTSEGRAIRRGLEREFPTYYRGPLGTAHRVGFTLKKILHNQQPSPYARVSYKNGIKVRIGSKNRLIAPGRHTYTLVYNTNRQIGFFDTHDEMYWNVTGNGWRLPIAQVTARIILPKDEKGKQAVIQETTAYTGVFGSRERAYRTMSDGDGIVVFETTRKLHPYEGLTVAVAFDKGVVYRPSWYQEVWWFCRDNPFVCVGLLSFLLALFFFVWAWMYGRRLRSSSPIIPRFYPPEDISPGDVRYIMRSDYDIVALLSDIVAMAVSGAVTIEQKKQSSTITLTSNEQVVALSYDYYDTLRASFFPGKARTWTLGKGAAATIQSILAMMRKRCSQAYDTRYFSRNPYALVGAFFFMLAFASFIFLVASVFIFIFFIPFFGAFEVSKRLFFVYTQEGSDLYAALAGFRLFLVTTEEDRRKEVGTPPLRTPQLYEKYLPYAIAFGVEKEWARAFEQIFATLEQRGQPYAPAWYIGLMPGRFSSYALTHAMRTNMRSAIAASKTPPGSVSGMGGFGGSGRGGGGGGGGGW